MKKVKIILLGSATVGKSSIISQYTLQKFNLENTNSTASDKTKKTVEIKEEKLELEIWDTVGQEIYKNVNKIFLKNSDIVILVYDITNNKSFEELQYWYNQVKEFNLNSETIFAVVGNKNDLNENKIVSKEKGEEFSKKLGINIFVEISAKIYKNVENLFDDVLFAYIDKKFNKEIEQFNEKNKIYETKTKIDEGKLYTKSYILDKSSFSQKQKEECEC